MRGLMSGNVSSSRSNSGGEEISGVAEAVFMSVIQSPGRG